MRIPWQSRLNQEPRESWTFVWVGDQAFGLFLSLRSDTVHWRGFVLASARCYDDLPRVRWSGDVLAEHFARYDADQVVDAQERLVAILAQRLGVGIDLVQARRPAPLRPLSAAQVHQMARFQPRK